MADDFRREIGAASLMGMIGGLLGGREGMDVRPVLSPHAHEIVAMRVRTEHGLFDVKVEPVDE